MGGHKSETPKGAEGVYRLNLKLDGNISKGLKALARINKCSRTAVVQQLLWAEIHRVGVDYTTEEKEGDE